MARPRWRTARSRRRPAPAMIAAAAGVAATGVLVTMAFVAPGYSTQEVDVDDASVWVTNGTQRMVGLANTQIAKLSTAVTAKSATLDVVQAPGRMLVHDTASNTVDLYDVAEVTVSSTVPLPDGTPRLAPAGSQLLIYEPDTGDTWASRYDDLAAFDHKSAATFNIGVDAVLAADELDRYVGYSAKSGQVVAGSLAADTAPKRDTIAFTDPSPAAAQATLVAGTPVVYDAEAAQVWVGSGAPISVADAVTTPDTAVLMQPTITGDRALIAFDGGLIAVDLDGNVTTLAEGSGAAAAPVRVGSCEYAVWGDGAAYRNCGTAETLTLDGANGAEPILAVNNRTVVANVPETGLTWAIQRSGERIDNWADFIDNSQVIEQQDETRDVPPDLDEDQKPPIAEDDTLGVRAGRANRLPVLINDSDPNGDAIVISEFTQLDPSFGRLDLITDAQELQLTTTPEAAGTVTFEYTITDGHGGKDAATVTVTVYPPEVNNPPEQRRSTRTSLASGGAARVNALDDWVDPESDPMYLADATTSGGSVNFEPEGTLEFVDSGTPGTLKTVAVVVSDGSEEGRGTLEATVYASGAAPIIAENFAQTGFTGQEITVEPLTKVRGGTGTITLNAANPAPGDESLTLTRDFTLGTFTVVAADPGTHYVEYSVTDGAETASALVRLEIARPPDEKLAPVTVPTTAFLPLSTTTLVDVLATDYDPSGGVLSIVGVDEEAAAEAGAIVEVVEQRILRVTLREPLESGPLTLAYEVSNGYERAAGTLTLVEIPEPTRLQPPVAEDDQVTVRVGSVVDIPVLANDRQPNGKPLQLDPTLMTDVPQGAGTLVVSGNRLRYLAPDKPGEYSAVYKVASTDGQWASATVSITVREVDEANNRPPHPETITVRVGAGQTTTIAVPLGSIDPDGDLVTLVGQGSTPPRRGTVTEIGTSSITYTADKLSSGTDTFTYIVNDALGATAEGTIRVGVVPDAGESAPPVAMDDSITTRPGTRLGVDVVANDSDPAQSPLKVVDVDAENSHIEATYTDSTVRLTAPNDPGSYAVLYTIANAAGLQSKAWLHINVDPDAPLIAPQARDVVLTIEEITDREKVDADVLATTSFSEGTTNDLTVSLPDDVSGARVTSAKKVNVDVRPTTRIVPFTVARADDESVSSTAFLWIPGTDDAAPSLRKDAPALKVISGEKLSIPINNYVIAAGKRQVKIADFATVSAVHSDGGQLWANPTTLTFTSAQGYYGSASITFTVTDGKKKATLNLPITVLPAEDQPPVLNSASVQVEAGQELPLDLWELTDYPGERSALTYEADGGDKSVVTATVDGSQLTLRAADGATIGQQAKVHVSVRAKSQKGKSAVITVTIVRSTLPTVVAVPDEVTVRRGSSETVDVLANDSATNPFPGKPLRVVSVGDSSLPGVHVSTSADKRTVTVAVDKNAETGAVTIPYRVADVTNDPSRYVSGVITARIQDVPDAPGAPRVVSTNDQNASVTLAIPHAYANNSDITEYVVVGADGGQVGRCENPDACVVTGLAYGQSYQFAAYAVNGVGRGAPGPLSATVVVDLVPNAPASVALAATATNADGHSMRVTWSNAGQVSKGTPIEGFAITLTGPGVSATATADPGATSHEFTDAGIAPGSSYEVSVRARNATHTGEPGTASAVAIGPPSVTAYASPTDAGRIQVFIASGNPNGAGTINYSVSQVATPIANGTACDVGGFAANVAGGVWTGDEWQDGAQFAVQVSNGLFCRTYMSDPAPNKPRATGGVSLTEPLGDQGLRDIQINNLGTQGGASADHYEYRLSIAGGGEVAWNRDPANVATPSDAYGRATTVYLRACFGEAEATCGPEARLGTVTPLRTRTTAQHCYAGRPAESTLPANNGLPATVHVQYWNVVGGTVTPVGDPVPETDNAPAAPEGGTLQGQWVVTLPGGAPYTDPNRIPCG